MQCPRRKPLLLRNLLAVIRNKFWVLSRFLNLNDVRASLPILSCPDQNLLLQLFEHGTALHHLVVVGASQFHSFFASACRSSNLASALRPNITRVSVFLNN